MATDDVNITEEAEMAECDGDKVVTMMDVLQEQQDFEEDANAVLGASDDKNCTYAKGYIKRQAIYACLTCCPEARVYPSKRAGVCLACSLNCHENHELVELYTKRNFRCDCGNPKFNSHPCQYTPSKPDLNDENTYNQNFSGLYCVCKRPYPDPEATVDDDMIQCIICEDWLHSSHLDAVVPANDQYAEMICKGCMEKNEFLHDYSNFAVNVESVDVVTVNGDKAHDAVCNGDGKDVVTNGTVDTTDVEMADKNCDGQAKEEKDSTTVSEDKKESDSKNQSVQGAQSDDKQASEAAKNNESANMEENVNEGKKDKISETEQTKDSDDKVESTETTDPSSEQKDPSSDDVEANKTEDQSADSKDTVQTSDNIAEESKNEGLEKLTDSATSEENIEATKQSSDESTCDNSVSDTNIQVPDTSQDDKNENTDDAVMNAIDKLLDIPTESEDKQTKSDLPESKETTDNEKVNEADTSERKENNQVPEATVTSTVDTEKSDTDVEMTENKDETENKKSNIETPDSISKIDESTSENTEETDTQDKDRQTDTDAKKNGDISDENKVLNENTETMETTNENKRKHDAELDETSPKKAKLDKCRRPKDVKKVYKGATFWASNFRQKLCTCGDCISIYKDLNVLFLTDADDTVSAYESLGKAILEGGISQYEKGLQALSSLDRIQQINALTEYNRMRDKLLDFLKSFKDRKEIVKEEDIKAFFAGMKPKREPDGVYFCR